MANQGSDRRTVLEMLAKAAAASQFPGFSRWAFGQEHQHAEHAPPPRPEHYQPSFFTASEFRTIEVLTDLIIPADETPGAREAGVAEFIDFMAAHGEKELRQPLRQGLEWLAATSSKSYDAAFTALTPDQQAALLKQSSTGAGRPFFFF